MTHPMILTGKDSATITPKPTTDNYGRPVSTGTPYTISGTYKENPRAMFKDQAGNEFLPSSTFTYLQTDAGRPDFDDLIDINGTVKEIKGIQVVGNTIFSSVPTIKVATR